MFSPQKTGSAVLKKHHNSPTLPPLFPLTTAFLGEQMASETATGKQRGRKKEGLMKNRDKPRSDGKRTKINLRPFSKLNFESVVAEK
jgi:hypothetical protein